MMSHVAVKICAVGDPPAFPELNNRVSGECLGFVILEKGTSKGKTSCAVVTRGKDGVPVIVEFTGDMFLSMAAALKGARQRFGDPWDGV